MVSRLLETGGVVVGFGTGWVEEGRFRAAFTSQALIVSIGEPIRERVAHLLSSVRCCPHADFLHRRFCYDETHRLVTHRLWTQMTDASFRIIRLLVMVRPCLPVGQTEYHG